MSWRRSEHRTGRLAGCLALLLLTGVAVVIAVDVLDLLTLEQYARQSYR